jgi:hypothetical protein
MSPTVSSPPGDRARYASLSSRAAAHVLLAASRALDRVASRLVALPHATAPTVLPSLEFHADAGAPEGALYVDGELVGYVPGVTRL